MTNKNNLRFKSLLNFIKSRLKTEKANNLLKKNKHIFIVDKKIKKKKIKLLFEELYKVSVYAINTCVLPIKFKNAKNMLGANPEYKKVFLKFKDSI